MIFQKVHVKKVWNAFKIAKVFLHFICHFNAKEFNVECYKEKSSAELLVPLGIYKKHVFVAKFNLFSNFLWYFSLGLFVNY